MIENFHELGRAKLAASEFPEAIEAFKKAIEAKQEIGWSYYNMSKAQLALAAQLYYRNPTNKHRLQLLDDAVKSAERAREILGDSTWVLLQLAKVHTWTKEHKIAIELVKKVLQEKFKDISTKDKTWAYSLLAQIEGNMGNYLIALKYAEEALIIDGSNEEAKTAIKRYRRYLK